jgi:hypothetical protein
LTVAPLLEQSHDLVTRLTIECHAPKPGTEICLQMWSIDYDATTGKRIGSSEFTKALQSKSGWCSDEVWVVGAKISTREGAHVRTMIGSGPSLYKIAPADRLEDVLSISIESGTFPLDAPVVIGRQHGGEIKLAIGSRAKLEELRERELAAAGLGS